MTRTHDGQTALVAALITAHWFTRSSGAMRSAAGHAAWLSALVAGLLLSALCLLLTPLLPKGGLWAHCRKHRALRMLPLLTALQLMLLCAGAWRGLLDSLAHTLLPETPRGFALLLTLPAAAAMGLYGLVPVMRTVKLLAPLLAALFAALLIGSAWGQANGYRLIPLLGEGVPGIAEGAGHALTAGAWLALLLPGSERGSASVKACLAGTLLGTAGYAVHALLLPLVSRGWTQVLSGLMLLPVQIAAVSAAPACAAQGLQSVFPAKRPGLWTYALLPVLALTALPDAHSCPKWLTALLEPWVPCALLLLQLLILFLHKACTAKEGCTDA